MVLYTDYIFWKVYGILYFIPFVFGLMSKIAVFDSGLGGLTVLSALRKELPGEDYIYYGDSANAPYGDKTPEELLKLNTQVCTRLLEADDIKCFVIACNTTTSETLDKLTKVFPEHDFIGIEPAVAWAVNEHPGEHVLVLATTATINGKRLKKRLEELKDKAEITALAAPGIVPFVENEKTGSEEFLSYLKELLAPYKKDTDAVVLGCTHFPFVKAQLKECFDKDISFYDAASLVAKETKELLSKNDRLDDKAKDGTTGSVTFLNSDTSKTELEEKLLNEYK